MARILKWLLLVPVAVLAIMLAIAAVFLVRMFLARRGAPAGSPLRYAPAGGTVGTQPETTPDPVRNG